MTLNILQKPSIDEDDGYCATSPHTRGFLETACDIEERISGSSNHPSLTIGMKRSSSVGDNKSKRTSGLSALLSPSSKDSSKESSRATSPFNNEAAAVVAMDRGIIMFDPLDLHPHDENNHKNNNNNNNNNNNKYKYNNDDDDDEVNNNNNDKNSDGYLAYNVDVSKWRMLQDSDPKESIWSDLRRSEHFSKLDDGVSQEVMGAIARWDYKNGCLPEAPPLHSPSSTPPRFPPSIEKRSSLEIHQRELITNVRMEIGPFAAPERVVIVKDLPKTRSGKIMRRILKKIAAGAVDDFGDVSALADPGVVDDIIKAERHARGTR